MGYSIGFKVEGLGFRVFGSGFGVSGSNLGVQKVSRLRRKKARHGHANPKAHFREEHVGLAQRLRS